MVTECPAGVQVVSGSVLLKGVWSVPIFSCKTFFMHLLNQRIMGFIVRLKQQCSLLLTCA